MDKAALLAFLKEHLSISVTVEQKTEFGPSERLSVKVELILDGDVVISESESDASLPTCSCSCS